MKKTKFNYTGGVRPWNSWGSTRAPVANVWIQDIYKLF